MGFHGQIVHPCFVAQQSALCPCGRGIDGQHGDFVATLDCLHAKTFNQGALSRARNSCDAEAFAPQCGRANFLQELGDALLMLRQCAFDPCDRLGQGLAMPFTHGCSQRGRGPMLGPQNVRLGVGPCPCFCVFSGRRGTAHVGKIRERFTLME